MTYLINYKEQVSSPRLICSQGTINFGLNLKPTPTLH